MSTAPTAEAMARLVDQRARASARVEAVGREAREAAAEAAEASAQLAEFERKGGPATQRRKLEDQLIRAKSRAAEPWHERHAGAEQRVRDADQELRQYQAEHLSELIEALEADGAIAAADLTTHAEGVVEAFARREEIARQIGLTAQAVGRIHPGDVSATNAQQLVDAASALIQAGGEIPPTLQRDPRQPRHGQVAAVEESAT
jgi:chromosome segregation ATPase